MATRIAWLLNLDADAELRDPATYPGLALPAARVGELMQRIFDLVAADDIVLDSRAPSLGEAPFDGVGPNHDVIALAFCPTPTALTKIAGFGLHAPDAPAFSVLRAVNDRRFSAQLGQTLPNAAFVDDMDALQRQLSQPSPSGSYVVKRAFSFAGREQRRLRNGEGLDASTRGFCARSFERHEGVQVEPWVERLADVSKHAYLMRDGQLLVGAARAQHVDAMGRFQHMLDAATELSAAETTQLDAEIERTGRALHAAGYFGPFGIDAFRYRLPDASVGFNPRCEINARFTMGYPRALLLEAIPLNRGEEVP